MLGVELVDALSGFDRPKEGRTMSGMTEWRQPGKNRLGLLVLLILIAIVAYIFWVMYHAQFP